MDTKAYFAQDQYYFSESEGQMVLLDQMAFPRLFYSHLKLLRMFGEEYEGTRLSNRFAQLLAPDPANIVFQVKKYGKACHIYTGRSGPVRSKMQRALRGLGSVTTHQHRHADGYGWIEAEVERSPVSVRVVSHRGS